MNPQAPRLEQDSEGVAIRGDGFEVRVDQGGRWAKLIAGQEVADLFLLSSCHGNDQPDYSYGTSPPVVGEAAGGVAVEITSDSSIWGSKKFSLWCFADRIEYFYSIRGTGDIDVCEFFQGFVGQAHHFGAGKPWINADFEGGWFGRVRSRPRFGRYFNPEPNGLRKQHFSSGEPSTIGVRSDKSRLRGNWFFTPGPLCYAIELSGGKWLAVGVVTKPGENDFVDFSYCGGNGFGLSLQYEGQARVDQTWESPHVVMLLADDEYAAIEKYCDHLRTIGCVPDSSGRTFDWWRKPIFCGWGAQCHMARVAGHDRQAPRYATQANYELFVQQLEQRGLNPGIVVIDDKWQERYGDPAPDRSKWPDLAGFIAGQHAIGRRVLLWLKAWDPEGLPPEECLVDHLGGPLGVDPANPAYERRLRQRIRELIGQIGADGFKIDFTAELPRVGKGWRGGGPWGIELLRRLLWIIYDEAKATKEDALIIAHAVNPYLADLVDMARLNDIAIVGLDDSYVESMVHRTRVARAVSKHWLVDTDNWPSPTLASWLEYVRRQPKLGVPSLYYTTHIDESGEEIGEAEAREVREIWAAYGRRMAVERGGVVDVSAG